MKLQNKLLLILLILALSVCLSLAASASEFDFIISDESVFSSQHDGGVGYIGSSTLQFNRSSDDYYFEICYLSYYTSDGEIFAFQPISFKSFVDYICYTSPGAATYEGFISACENQYSVFGSSVYDCWINTSGNLNEEYFNKLYYYGSTPSYEDGITEGIKQAHQFTSDWLDENDILFEPWGADGEFSSLNGLLNDNIINALNLRYNAGYNLGYSTAHDEVYPLAFADGVNASIVRLENWLSGKNILYRSYDKDGDLATINQVMDNNVSQALDERGNADYNAGVTDGQALGQTSMYNELISNINTSFKTEYPLSDGSTYDFTVTNQAYSVAFQAGEAYQINKLTDDGGISDFLADISGIVLSTFFYLGSNISFMGTTALSLISLFVIAAIVIFILKFVLKS